MGTCVKINTKSCFQYFLVPKWQLQPLLNINYILPNQKGTLSILTIFLPYLSSHFVCHCQSHTGKNLCMSQKSTPTPVLNILQHQNSSNHYQEIITSGLKNKKEVCSIYPNYISPHFKLSLCSSSLGKSVSMHQKSASNPVANIYWHQNRVNCYSRMIIYCNINNKILSLILYFLLHSSQFKTNSLSLNPTFNYVSCIKNKHQDIFSLFI